MKVGKILLRSAVLEFTNLYVVSLYNVDSVLLKAWYLGWAELRTEFTVNGMCMIKFINTTYKYPHSVSPPPLSTMIPLTRMEL